ncbi:acetylglutamate kinase [Lentilactobacillus kisonensis]|uniref:Acetylglutamate kinase n=1 Tax=Lentilactobacillus kisonensis F0435 TaxID=797516 RepID=H1LEC6_9LACO|nr:acetylglutamate kinase [Lentilactobacillus kisonensis]EHO52501.1 acetylglutamate kinase [Lentilactobacillus kisonensis F0435]
MGQTIVIKIGGNATTHLSPAFYQQLASWHQAGKQVLIVHGGGPQISQWSSQLNLPVSKINGIRVTGLETLKVTQAVLLGLVQPNLCRHLADHKIPALSLNGAGIPIIQGAYLDKAVYGEVGKVTGVNCDYINQVLERQIGVCAPLAITKDGKVLNVNGDVAAAAVAKLLGAEKLVLLTDVPGIMVANHVVGSLTPGKAKQLVEKEIVQSGMRPKITAAFEALRSGVKEVAITNELKHSGTSLTTTQAAI